jgi:hypothetical protein
MWAYLRLGGSYLRVKGTFYLLTTAPFFFESGLKELKLTMEALLVTQSLCTKVARTVCLLEGW